MCGGESPGEGVAAVRGRLREVKLGAGSCPRRGGRLGARMGARLARLAGECSAEPGSAPDLEPGLTYSVGGAGPPWAEPPGHGAGSERGSEGKWLALMGQPPGLCHDQEALGSLRGVWTALGSPQEG